MGEPALKLVDKPEIEFVGVPSTELDRVWPIVEPMIQKAVDTDEFEIWDTINIYEQISMQRNQLWVAIVDNKIVAAFITSLSHYPKAYALEIHWVGGSMMDKWLDIAWTELTNFARASGCHVIRGYGRNGWIRKLKLKVEKQLIWQTDL